MTVLTTASFVVVKGNGATTVFNYNFLIPGSSSTDQTNVQVTYTDALGNVTILTNSQYTITGVQNATGGTVTFTLANNVAIASGATLKIARVLPFTQPDTIANQSNFYPAAVEAAIDNVVMELQQVIAQNNDIVNWRGVWQTATKYNVGDFVIDGANGSNTSNVYFCSIANTSSASWANDLAAGDWQLVISLQQIQNNINANIPYVVPMFYAGGTLSNSQVIGYHIFPSSVKFPANFGATGGTGTGTSEGGGTATASAAMTFNFDYLSTAPNTWTNFGSASIASASSSMTFTTVSGNTWSFNAGNVIRGVGPATADTRFANPFLTLAATRV